MTAVIHVESLGKLYRIGELQGRGTLRDRLTHLLDAPRRLLAASSGQGKRERAEIWALRDVNFEVRQGEIVGLIGRNGAGKSTLLKILSRVTQPTTGWAEVRGRMGTLLEVGTGFHPELTGRENVFLNGAILGMSKAEITRKFDEIVAFSEVEKFIDTPVKRYSSGMYVRLAFAVAAHLETEILFVDEVLSVGDASFQKKCLGKMGDVARQGRTIIFVSHNVAAVTRLCSRCILLENGTVEKDGPTHDIVGVYLRSGADEMRAARRWDMESAPGNDLVKLKSAGIRPVHDVAEERITVRTPVVIEFEYWNLRNQARVNLSLHIQTERGETAFSTVPVTDKLWHGKPLPLGLFRSRCYIPGDLLNNGVHHITLYVVEDQSRIIYGHENILQFEVHDDVALRAEWYGHWAGATRPNLEWTTEFLSPTGNEPNVPIVAEDA